MGLGLSRRLRVVVGALGAVALGVPPCARAEEPLKAAWKPTPPVRVTEGHSPWLSPEGTHLAFHRWINDGTKRDGRGQPVGELVLHVRDLATGAERRASRSGRVAGWSGEDLIVLSDGTTLRVGGSGEEPAFPTTPEGRWASAEGRSQDARTYAYVGRADMAASLQKGEDRIAEQSVHLVRLGEPTRALRVGDGPDFDGSPGFVAPSPTGKHLACHLSFMHWGQPPHPRVAVVNLESGEATFVLDEPYGSQGAHDASRWQTGVSGQFVWDGRGEWFTFVRTAGDRLDLYVASADGKQLRRLTNDGRWKAQPCLSPEGERCAYWTTVAEGAMPAAEEAEQETRMALRVLHLKTGELVALPTPEGARGDDLQWSHDGRALWFQWDGKEGAIFRIEAPPALAVPAGTPIVDRTASPLDELLSDLASADDEQIDAALPRARAFDDPRVTVALRRVLARWNRSDRPLSELVEVLQARRAVSAVPELLEALARGEWTSSVSPPLLEWRVDAAIPLWRRIALRGRPSSRGPAAVALARMGEPDGWALITRCLEEPEKADLSDLIYALGTLRDPRSVDILVPRVRDTKAIYADSPTKNYEIGDAAVNALKKITGQSFGRDAHAWAAWWEQVAHTLPAEAADGGGGR